MAVVVEQGIVEEAGLRVDRWATDHFLRLPSRAAARKAAKRGDLLLNGQLVESSRFVQPGDHVVLHDSSVAHEANRLVPEVVHLDDHMAVVIKPAGVLTNGARFRTLERGLPNSMKRSPAPDALLAPKPVHRLDYETYGLVVVARTESAMVALGRAFEAREVHKSYAAFVAGRLEGEGELCEPLDGRDAVSRYRVTGHFRSLKVQWVSMVDLHPTTGRMHQLRRHMQGAGHAILGDRRYTEGPVLRKNGLFLAAVALELAHPISGAPLAFRIPPPEKFDNFRAHHERRWRKFHPEGA